MKFEINGTTYTDCIYGKNNTHGILVGDQIYPCGTCLYEIGADDQLLDELDYCAEPFLAPADTITDFWMVVDDCYSSAVTQITFYVDQESAVSEAERLLKGGEWTKAIENPELVWKYTRNGEFFRIGGDTVHVINSDDTECPFNSENLRNVHYLLWDENRWCTADRPENYGEIIKAANARIIERAPYLDSEGEMRDFESNLWEEYQKNGFISDLYGDQIHNEWYEDEE